MIFINPDNIHFPLGFEDEARRLFDELKVLEPKKRSKFIEDNCGKSWGHPDLLAALRQQVGNKCWYSEVPLEGADPNIDHFRPKGRVLEVDKETFCKTGSKIENGYWWLAFEPKNFRLSCMHSNQRRVDKETEGGKADFFPVDGKRANEGTEWGLIAEDVLPFDPCSCSDTSLMWFDPDGNPCLSGWRRAPTDKEKCRLRVTVWLYHLDKVEIIRKRAAHIQKIRTELQKANIAYKLWDPRGENPDLVSKNRFDASINGIKTAIADTAEFAGAKRCAVKMAVTDYPWIEEFGVI